MASISDELRPGARPRDCRHGSDRDRAAGIRPDGDTPRANEGMVRSLPTRRQTGLPVLRRAELALAGQERHLARRTVKVPEDAFVTVRSGPAALAGPLRLSAPIPVRTQDRSDRIVVRGAWRPKMSRILRELVMLLLLAATLAGTFYLGRVYAFQNVIVLPDPDRGHSVVT